MSVKHPIISITGSSGAGTSSVKATFKQIFRRERISVAYVEGDSFHRYNREEMKAQMGEAQAKGHHNFSHFGPAANLLFELEKLFREYGETGSGSYRHYAHDENEAAKLGCPQAPSQNGKSFRLIQISYSMKASMEPLSLMTLTLLAMLI